MSENYSSEIYEQKPDHAYRTEIPNIIFELGLDSYELSLYVFIKKVAGDDRKCWQTVKHLADACDMGEKKLRACKKKLSSSFDKLGHNPLIIITSRTKEDGSADTDLIEISPIWRTNGDYFRNKFGGSRKEPGVVPVGNQGGSRGEPKEEPSEEKPKEELLCSFPPVGEKLQKIFEFSCKDHQGNEVVVRLNELVFSSVKLKKDWTMAEIEKSFDIMSKYEKISDPLELMGGIIKRSRVNEHYEKKSEKVNPKKEEEKPKVYEKCVNWIDVENELIREKNKNE
jgi:hypothetical protein